VSADLIRGYADAAPRYRAAGWLSVLPLPARRKQYPPEGFTGRLAAEPTQAQVQVWMRQFPSGNVALRLPVGVLGVDLDLYKPAGVASYATLVDELGPLPPTWVSTARDDGSGIRLYRVPAQVRWAERRAGPGIELIHSGHRYLVVWPSLHPDTLDRYRWWPPHARPTGRLPTVAQLPPLPPHWGRRLSEPPPRPQPATVDTHSGRPASGGYAQASLAGAVADLAAMGAGSGRNNALNRKAYHLGGLVAAGHLDLTVVRAQLYHAAQANGHVDRHGPRQTLATIESGLRAGMNRPRRSA
jgi:hypothetical protein